MASVTAATREVQGSALLGHANRWLFTARTPLLSLFSSNSLVRAWKITFALKHLGKAPRDFSFSSPAPRPSLRRRYGEDVEIPFSAVILLLSLFPSFTTCLLGCLSPFLSPPQSLNHLVSTIVSWQHRYAGPSVSNQRAKGVCVSVSGRNKRCEWEKEWAESQKKNCTGFCFIDLLLFPTYSFFFFFLNPLLFFTFKACALLPARNHCSSCVCK